MLSALRFAARCPLLGVSCMLFAACCLSRVVCYALSVARCRAARFPLYGVCCMLSAERGMLRVVGCTWPAMRCPPHA
jgi:hypothetical protein